MVLDKWPYIEFTCKHGHNNRLIIGFELYELLFQQATYCLMDGYYRETITTYNVSLERFFEYSTEAMLLSVAKEIDIDKLWKNVKNQYERQLEAYYYMYASQFHELPQFLEPRKVELRNEVVHKGKLAGEAEAKAKAFGEYCFNYVRSTYKN